MYSLTNNKQQTTKRRTAIPPLPRRKGLPAAFCEQEVDIPTSNRVFISYRSNEQDINLAQEFYEELTATGYQSFMAAQSIQAGENWSQRIDEELQQCDYFLLLLSQQSATSEMVMEEVRQVKKLSKSRPDKKPIIVVIRVNLPQSFTLNYELRAYLSQIQYLTWTTPADTPRILQEILSLLEQKSVLILEASLEEWPVLPPVRENPNNPPSPVAEPELPKAEPSVLAARIYVERSPIEQLCYNTILNPETALIRIKAPQQMGKTALMANILYQAKNQGCLTVALNFQQAVFDSKEEFLKWFCKSIEWRLNLPNKLDDYWQNYYGSNDNCTIYFERYLLANITKPLVLALDQVDYVFSYPQIASDFFGLLRFWHENPNNNDIWKKLRLVLVHSTEVYIDLDIDRSPFNVGLPIQLLDFNLTQVQSLAQQCQLNLDNNEIESLMALVGGHPYLLRLAFYNLAQLDIKLDQLLQSAPTDDGIYADHLQRLLWILQQHPELADAMKTVLTTNDPVSLEREQAFKLNSMGLVLLKNNEVTSRYQLYRQYFRDRL